MEKSSIAGDPDGASAPTLAARARTLVHVESCGALATNSATVSGFPFTSLAPFAVDALGRPVFLFSKLAQHTRNLAADARGALLVSRAGADGRAVSGPRATLLGEITRVDGGTGDLRAPYLRAHPEATGWIDFADFAFYRMEVERVYHVSGFGSMGWIEGALYATAAVDPLADVADAIIVHMNEDHADALVLYARVYAGFEADRCKMSSVDGGGFEILAERESQNRHLRIPFVETVRTADEARTALVEMARAARARSAP